MLQQAINDGLVPRLYCPMQWSVAIGLHNASGSPLRRSHHTTPRSETYRASVHIGMRPHQHTDNTRMPASRCGRQWGHSCLTLGETKTARIGLCVRATCDLRPW